MKPTILLFDIDGTLITTGGVGRRSIDRTFGALYGNAKACSSFSFSGMTDRGIMRLGLEALGQHVTEQAIDTLINHYLVELEDEVSRATDATYRAHRGMHRAIEAGRAAGMAVGLGTGNVSRGARIKLARVGLADSFSFGGYGDDHELRATLIRIGAERGAAQLQCTLPEARVVVIGDTPKDIAAAHAVGAQSLAVSTGEFSVAALQAAGATWVFDSIDSDAARAAMLGKTAA